MADFYSIKDDAAKLVIQLGTEIDLFFVLASFLLLLDAYLYTGSNEHYSLLTFDWSSQHGFNVGAILGFFVAFSFVMTVVTPLLLMVVDILMVLPWYFIFPSFAIAIAVAFKVGIPFLGAIFVALATAPAWRDITGFFRNEETLREKWRAPHGFVYASRLREFAYKHEKVFLMDRVDKHYAAKEAGKNRDSERLAAGFLVTVVVNALFGYSGRGTIVWYVLKWSSGLSENRQDLIQIALAIFLLLVLGLVADFFRSGHDPDWMYYPALAAEEERELQARLEREAQYERSVED